MPTSGVLECNQNFKYPKKLPAALNSSILAENGAGSTNNSYFIMPTGWVLHWNQYLESAKNCLRRQKKREKKNKRREGTVYEISEREEIVYKISEREPSEREARQTCERMRKMASSRKVPAPALHTFCDTCYLNQAAVEAGIRTRCQMCRPERRTTAENFFLNP